jgi:3-hydroxymyristoyl/3-hydroxydecanoyl-(acyl carrier protein) dehydratase
LRFLFFDRVIELENGTCMRALKDVALSEEFFTGHFARRAIAPGTILTEAVAQVAGWLVIASMDFRRGAIVSIIEDVAVLRDVRPGDQLTVDCRILDVDKRCAWALGRGYVGDQEAIRVGRMMFALVPFTGGATAQRMRERFEYFSGRYLARSHGDA